MVGYFENHANSQIAFVFLSKWVIKRVFLVRGLEKADNLLPVGTANLEGTLYFLSTFILEII